MPASGTTDAQQPAQGSADKIRGQSRAPASPTERQRAARFQLVEQRLRDLGNFHFQHHLLWRAHRQKIDDGSAARRDGRITPCSAGGDTRSTYVCLATIRHWRRAPREGRCHLHDPVHGRRIIHGTADHQRIASRTHTHIRLIRQQRSQCTLHRARIQSHHDFDQGAQAATSLHHHIAAADLPAQHIQRIGRYQRGVQHGRITNAARLYGFRHLHQLGLAQCQIQTHWRRHLPITAQSRLRLARCMGRCWRPLRRQHG